MKNVVGITRGDDMIATTLVLMAVTKEDPFHRKDFLDRDWRARKNAAVTKQEDPFHRKDDLDKY